MYYEVPPRCSLSEPAFSAANHEGIGEIEDDEIEGDEIEDDEIEGNGIEGDGDMGFRDKPCDESHRLAMVALAGAREAQRKRAALMAVLVETTIAIELRPMELSWGFVSTTRRDYGCLVAVENVTFFGPAERAGLHVGDIIISHLSKWSRHSPSL